MKKKYLIISVIFVSIVMFLSLNDTSFAQDAFENNIQISKRYDGQRGYGSSGICDCGKYLKDRYKGKITEVCGKSLDVLHDLQSDFAQNEREGNCALVSVTKLVNYYLINGDIEIKDNSVEEIYQTVKKIAVNKYGYAGNGIKALYMKPLIEDVFKYYDYKVEVKFNTLTLDFNEQVKKEIDNNRPIILINTGIFGGYYGAHALPIRGYKVYNVSKRILFFKRNKEYPMIEVTDGWEFSNRYIDYDKFKHELQGFASSIITVVIEK